MATRTIKTPPHIHPAFDVKPVPAAPEPPTSNAVRGVAAYGTQTVTFEVRGDGHRVIVDPPELAGVLLPTT